jgi:hypothetical protein
MGERIYAENCENCDALCRPKWLTEYSRMFGQCRRWSPRPTVGSFGKPSAHVEDNRVIWPIVDLGHWCLEWAPKRGTTGTRAAP